EVVGEGMSYSSLPDEADPHRGAVLRATAPMSTFVRLGPGTGAASGGDQAGASISNITVDGNGLAGTPLKTQGRRNRIHNTYALRGTVCALDMAGQNGEITGYSVFDQRGFGDVIITR